MTLQEDPKDIVVVGAARTPQGRMLGALAKSGRPVVSLEDFDAVSDELWRGSDYGRPSEG